MPSKEIRINDLTWLRWIQIISGSICWKTMENVWVNFVASDSKHTVSPWTKNILTHVVWIATHVATPGWRDHSCGEDMHFIRCLRGCLPQHPQDKAYILYYTLMTGVLERAICVWHEGQRPSKGSIVLHWKCVASMSATVDHVHHWHWPRTTWHSPNGSRLTCLSACETFGLFTPSAEKIVQACSVHSMSIHIQQLLCHRLHRTCGACHALLRCLSLRLLARAQSLSVGHLVCLSSCSLHVNLLDLGRMFL